MSLSSESVIGSENPPAKELRKINNAIKKLLREIASSVF
jgi:hypothetical protein